jgi:hypothetical protein
MKPTITVESKSTYCSPAALPPPDLLLLCSGLCEVAFPRPQPANALPGSSSPEEHGSRETAKNEQNDSTGLTDASAGIHRHCGGRVSYRHDEDPYAYCDEQGIPHAVPVLRCDHCGEEILGDAMLENPLDE